MSQVWSRTGIHCTWEELLGSLLCLEVLVAKVEMSSEISTKIYHLLRRALVHVEARVRLAAGSLLGSLCLGKFVVFDGDIRKMVLDGIDSNITRDSPVVTRHHSSVEIQDLTNQNGRSSPEVIILL